MKQFVCSVIWIKTVFYYCLLVGADNDCHRTRKLLYYVYAYLAGGIPRRIPHESYNVKYKSSTYLFLIYLYNIFWYIDWLYVCVLTCISVCEFVAQVDNIECDFRIYPEWQPRKGPVRQEFIGDTTKRRVARNTRCRELLKKKNSLHCVGVRFHSL